MQKTSHSITFALLIGAFAFGTPFSACADHADPADVAANDLVAAAEREDWAGVKLYARHIRDPLLAEYATWLGIQHNNTKASFSEISRFVDRHPTWPRQTELRRRAEHAIDDKVSHLSLLDWFERYSPVSGKGALAHLNAISSARNTAEIPELTRSYWLKLNFDAAYEKEFLRTFGGQLDRETHIARLDRLIWQRGHNAATRMLKYVPADHRALARARIALLRRSGGVDGKISSVPDHLSQAPELWFERLQWRRRKDKNDSAGDILKSMPSRRPRPELWAKEGLILARRAFANGHYSEAAKLVSGHGLSRGREFAESEFLAGWIRLSFLSEPSAAEQHFEALYNGVSYPISRARGAYWKGRAENSRGNTQLAKDWWLRAAQHPTTYYGQIATLALGQKPDKFNFAVPSDPEIRREFLRRELVELVHHLHGLGADKQLRTLLLHLSGLAGSAEERLLVAQLAHESKRPREAVRAVKRLNQLDNIVGVAGYPLTPVPDLTHPYAPEDALVLAVIRQESGFDQTAISRAGARGMMQLLPGTAKQVSKSLSIPYTRAKLTTDPNYNIRLGQAYLAQMLDKFFGSPPLALAAYNAGPHRVDRWLKKFGDPRTGQINMVDWIESIPFHETRNYVQRVSEAATVYRYLLSGVQVADIITTPLHTLKNQP
ncbi:MAG: lytic transglycosylase domain-containing protein [Alphaproteobacteria bacterium]|nr:lytic transglycosylase domain-containing protein [Alphaproteobacteria bacterium]